MEQKAVTVESIESIYRHLAEDLFRLALARSSNPELARDAVQESFARATRARAGFRGSGSLEAWISRCVLSATQDDRLPAVEPDLHDGDGIVWKAETPDADLRAAVRQIPALQRDTLFLRFFLDFDYLTIAETLGIGAGEVSATLHAARRNLTQALDEVTG